MTTCPHCNNKVENVMATCPYCNNKISHLKMYRKCYIVNNLSLLGGNEPVWECKRHIEDIEYVCPICENTICFADEDAVEFLRQG